MAIEKKWIVKEQGNPAAVRALSAELGIDQVLANLLVQRNITTADRAREFFKPDLSKLHDPFLMKDMDKAVERLEKAISSEEKVLTATTRATAYPIKASTGATRTDTRLS